MSFQSNADTWLVSCSPERTLLARRGPGQEGTLLVKLFEQGSLSSAQREVAFANLVEGMGFAHCRGACRDPDSGKPSLIMDLYAGSDLFNWVSEHGPLSITESALISVQIANRLVALGSVRASLAPAGVVHRDIKPGNIFLHGDPSSIAHCEVVVLDLEHAIANRPDATDATDSNFSGGSHGYSPPEAYRGATPEPSFDVFGLGCTLHFMLTGNSAFRAEGVEELAKLVTSGQRYNQGLLGVPTTLRELIEACLAKDPKQRPKAEEIGQLLDKFIADQTDRDRNLDRIFTTIQTGNLILAKEKLAQTPSAQRCARWEQLETRCAGAEALLSSHPLPAATRAEVGGAELADILTEQAPALAEVLSHFPAHPGAISQKQELLNSAAVLLLEVPQLVAEHNRHAAFKAATDLVQSTLKAIEMIDQLGRIPVAGVVDEQPPPTLQDPRRFLSSTLRDLEFATEQHRKLFSALLRAETALDMSAAEQALATFAKVYGGASPVVADLKDRVHRLDFYLARIAKLAPALVPLREQLERSNIDIDLQEVESFLGLCAKHMPNDGSWQPSGESESLLRLQRYIDELVSEHPHLEDKAASARITLGDALAEITDKAWTLLDTAKQQLATPPIPIRLLQHTLNQLDHFRVAEMLVDRPGRERIKLLDRLEDLRMQLDHSRNARDRITRGVRASMEEGHLTTALYEISRAVDRFDDEEIGNAPDGSPLARQFAEAKRRKEEIEETQRKNHQLASQFASMREAGQASDLELMAVLQDRERALQFLCISLGKERAEMYAEDLQSVQLELMRAHANKGKPLVEAAKHPRQRLVIAEQTLNSLRRRVPERGCPPGLYAEASSLISTWEKIYQSAEGELSDEAAQRRKDDLISSSQRKRWAVRKGATFALLAASLITVLMIWPEESSATGRVTLNTLERSLQGLQFRQPEATAIVGHAKALLRLVRALDEDGSKPPQSWLPSFTAAVTSFDRGLTEAPDSLREQWRELGRAIHRAGIVAAGSDFNELAMDDHLTKTRDLSISTESSK